MAVDNGDNNDNGNPSMSEHPTDSRGDRVSPGSRNADDFETSGTQKRTKRPFYHQLETIYIQFAKHYAFPHLHEALNGCHDFDIDFEELLNRAKNNFKDAPNVISDILTHAAASISPYASRTTDKTVIAPLLQACHLEVKNPTNNFFFAIYNASDLEKAIQDIIRENRNSSRLTLPLYLKINQWYLDESKPLDPLNFALFSLTPFPTPADSPPAAARSKTGLQGAQATSKRRTTASVDELIQLIQNSGKRPFQSIVNPKNTYINGEIIEREQTETEFKSYIWKLLDAAGSGIADDDKNMFPLACMICGSGGGKTTTCRLMETSWKSRIQESINEYLKSKQETTVETLSIVFAALNNTYHYSGKERENLDPATSLGIRLVAARYGWSHKQVHDYLRKGQEGAKPYEDARKYNGISLERFLRKLNPESEKEAVIIMIDGISKLKDDDVNKAMDALCENQHMSLREQKKKFICVAALTTKPFCKLIGASRRPVTPISLPPVSPKEVLRQAHIFANRIIQRRRLDPEKYRHHLISQFCASGGTFRIMRQVVDHYEQIDLRLISNSFYGPETEHAIKWGRHILRCSVFNEELVHTDEVLDDEGNMIFNRSSEKFLVLEDLILEHQVVVTKGVTSPVEGLAVMIRIPTILLNALAAQWQQAAARNGEVCHLYRVMEVLEKNRQMDSAYSKIFEVAIMHVLCLRLSLKATCKLEDILPHCELPNKAMRNLLEKRVKGVHCRWVEVDCLTETVVNKAWRHGTMVYSKKSNEGAVEGFWCLTVEGKPFYIFLQMKFWDYCPPGQIEKWESAIHKRAKTFGLLDGDYVPLFFSTSEKFQVKSSLAMPQKATENLLEPFGICPMMLYAQERYMEFKEKKKRSNKRKHNAEEQEEFEEEPNLSSAGTSH